MNGRRSVPFVHEDESNTLDNKPIHNTYTRGQASPHNIHHVGIMLRALFVNKVSFPAVGDSTYRT